MSRETATMMMAASAAFGYLRQRRRKEQRDRAHQQRGQNPRRLGARAGAVVDHSAAESARHGHPSRQRSSQVGPAERDQLLIRIDRLAAPVGERLGDGHTLDIADQPDQDASGQQLHRSLRSGEHEPEVGQSGRERANDGHPMACVEPEPGDQESSDEHDRQRRGFSDHSRPGPGNAQPHERALQRSAGQQEQRHAERTEAQGRQTRVPQTCRQAHRARQPATFPG